MIPNDFLQAAEANDEQSSVGTIGKRVATVKKAVTVLRMSVQIEFHPHRRNIAERDEAPTSGVQKKHKSQSTVHRVCVRCGQESYMRSRWCKAHKAVLDCLYYNYVSKPKALAKKATKDQAGAIAAADAQAKEFIENCTVDGHAIKAMELWEESNITSRKYCKKATIAYGDFAKVFAVRVGKRQGRDEVPMEKEQYHASMSGS
eukprot:2810900-Amphidinium_carterae.4